MRRFACYKYWYRKKTSGMKIDFVIPWVDGSDPAWQKEKYKYVGIDEPDAGVDRYRDMGILKYWFRAVEAYAPWVNQVHFITWGHLPEWLNAECPKLHIVNHKDYIPEEFLPTFSSHPIELNIHRISGMSEHFVYFNDDMFLNGPVKPEFFFRKGKPCDFLRCAPIEFSDTTDVYAHVSTNSIRKVNFYYSYAKLFLRHPSKLVNVRYGLAASLDNFAKLGNIHHYVGLKDHHLPNAYCKKTFLDVWKAMPEVMDRVSGNQFRTPFDVSQSVCRYWQLASGQFYPVSQSSRGRYLSISYPIDYVEATLNDPNIKMVCINDTSRDVDFEQTMTQIVALFEKKLPNKSSFEK